MRLFAYMRNLLDVESPDSSKSFTLVISALVSAIVGLTMCFVIVYDVLTNGYVKTDLNDAGVFLLCAGGYMAGAGVTKAVVDSGRGRRRRRRPSYNDIYGNDSGSEDEEEEEVEEEGDERRNKR